MNWFTDFYKEENIISSNLEFCDSFSLKFHDFSVEAANNVEYRNEISKLKFDPSGCHFFCANTKGNLHIYYLEEYLYENMQLK